MDEVSLAKGGGRRCDTAVSSAICSLTAAATSPVHV